jgi:hypothetical protein
VAGCAAVVGGLIALAALEAEPATAPSAAPSRELLLYLAEFGAADDEWVDPADVAAQLDREPDPTASPTATDPRRPPTDDDDVPPPADR